MPITPVFTVTQDDATVTVRIRAPYIKVCLLYMTSILCVCVFLLTLARACRRQRSTFTSWAPNSSFSCIRTSCGLSLLLVPVSCHPSYAVVEHSLTFPGDLVENGQEQASYDISAGRLLHFFLPFLF